MICDIGPQFKVDILQDALQSHGKRWAPFGESGRAPELKAYFENVQAKPEQTKAERNTLHSKGLCKEAEFVQFK